MASKKREQEYDANRRHYKDVLKGFKFGFIATVIMSGGVFVCMSAYYFIRALALLAGASMAMGQHIVNSETGGTETAGLGYTVPYAFMGFIFIAAAFSAAGFFLKRRGFNRILLGLYAAGALYGLIGLFAGLCGVLTGLYLFTTGCIGTWIESYILQLHKELDWLSLQEGYPDFIVAIDEPKTMANTNGLTYKQSEFQMRQRKLRGDGEDSEESPQIPQNAEMDELTVDTPLPKGNRKIDNML